METNHKLEPVARETANVLENIGLLLGGVSDLTKNEIRLAKLEVREFFGAVVDAAVKRVFLLILRMFLALAGLCFITTSAVFGLNEYLGQSYSVSLLAVGSVLVIVGIFIVPLFSKKWSRDSE